MEQAKADQLYDLKATEMDQRAMDLALADAETRRAINMATVEYNQALVSEGGRKRKGGMEGEGQRDEDMTESSRERVVRKIASFDSNHDHAVLP